MDPPSLGLNSPAEVDVFAVQAIAVIQAPERSEGLAAHSQGGTEHPIDSLRLGHHLIEHQMMPLDLGVSEEQSERRPTDECRRCCREPTSRRLGGAVRIDQPGSNRADLRVVVEVRDQA